MTFIYDEEPVDIYALAEDYRDEGAGDDDSDEVHDSVAPPDDAFYEDDSEGVGDEF